MAAAPRPLLAALAAALSLALCTANGNVTGAAQPPSDSDCVCVPYDQCDKDYVAEGYLHDIGDISKLEREPCSLDFYQCCKVPKGGSVQERDRRALVGVVKGGVGNRQGWQEDETFTPNPNFVEVTKSSDDLSGGALDPSSECVCVPYYQCDPDHFVIQDGVGIIDIRQKEGPCEHYLDSCCKLRDGQGNSSATAEPSVPAPTPDPEPWPQPQPGPGPDPNPWSPQPTPPPTRPTPTRPSRPSEPQVEQPHPTPPARAQRCGQRNVGGIGFRITGDEDGEAQYGEFPWMVAVLQLEWIEGQEKPLNLYQCGGALITAQVVLTGAHCVAGKQANLLKIRAGEWDTQTTKELYAHQDRGVATINVHPRFNDKSLHNDAALLILLDPVQIGGHIGTICLPPAGMQFDYKRCYASGWGKDKFGQDGQYQVILKKRDLPVVPRAQCQELLRKTRLGAYFLLDPSFICAGGEPGRDTCKGDGGSPLVCPIDNESERYYQAGIVAWGIDCGLANTPGVYGNVAQFRNWIDNELSRLNLDTSSYQI
ncbi:Phenoloxidase-activating factor 2 [Frankliniella fusca]|uniref:Phenoloxidase-activating factor 2 n=1 Tax=Frankliniella fusca TaxID=407009 RepID=A0AAE1HI76_9NEOP|nr:Phenoloxidase-activating factor 2 [Frankliniella fusca]